MNENSEININILKINSSSGKYTKTTQGFLSSEINKLGVNWHFFINNNDIILFAKKFINVSERNIVILPDNYEESIRDEIRYGKKLPNTYRFENFKEGKMSFWSPIKIINDKIYTVLKDDEGKPIIICIKK
jgi:hypothetical protein